MRHFKPGEVWKIAAGHHPYVFQRRERAHEEDRFYVILHVHITVRKKFTEYNINVINCRTGEQEVLYFDSKTWRTFFFKVEDEKDV